MLAQVGSVKEAETALSAGVDGIIAQGQEAMPTLTLSLALTPPWPLVLTRGSKL